MILLLAWTFFVILVGLTKKLDITYYIFFTVLMLYFTYIYDQICPLTVSLRTNLCLLFIPSVIFWYITFVYNNFLCLTPINYKVLRSMLFFHIYVLMYIFHKSS